MSSLVTGHRCADAGVLLAGVAVRPPAGVGVDLCRSTDEGQVSVCVPRLYQCIITQKMHITIIFTTAFYETDHSFFVSNCNVGKSMNEIKALGKKTLGTFGSNGDFPKVSNNFTSNPQEKIPPPPQKNFSFVSGSRRRKESDVFTWCRRNSRERLEKGADVRSDLDLPSK